jgi:hypothetical protein
MARLAGGPYRTAAAGGPWRRCPRAYLLDALMADALMR